MAEYLHTMVRITDPEKSRAFYEAALEPLGYRVLLDFGTVVGMGKDRPDFWLAPAKGTPTTCHVSFRAESEREVQRLVVAECPRPREGLLRQRRHREERLGGVGQEPAAPLLDGAGQVGEEAVDVRGRQLRLSVPPHAQAGSLELVVGHVHLAGEPLPGPRLGLGVRQRGHRPRVLDAGDRGRLGVGQRADVVALDEELRVRRVWREGRELDLG